MVERRGRLQQKGGLELKVAEPEDSGPGASTGKAAGFFAEGSRFGAYVIGSCIGHGGMARIYRAEHEGLRRQVALKVLTDGVEPGTEGRARFLREARIAAAIKHPNVVNIFDIGVENKVPYLVMELLVGQDLETLLASHGALSEHTIIDVLIPVVAGLVAVHDAGIVHRDLKPGNIFLSRGPNEEIEPKLLDFGISRSSTAGENMRLTSTRGLLMGTPLYMSPEALLGADMTPLSDQYSLGVVLYECATGVNPFISGSVAETARRVTTGQYTPIADQPIRPSRRLQMIIERAMSLEPSKRFPDMRAFGQELLTLAGQRTRITWGLTFGAVATAARANTRDIETGAVALARTRPPKQGRRVQAWPMFAAAAAGVVTMVALFAWSAKRDAIRGEAMRSDALHGDNVHTVEAKTIPSGLSSAKSPVAGAGGSTAPLVAAALPSAPAVVPASVVPASAGSPSAVPSSSVTPSSAAAGASAQPRHVGSSPAPSPVPSEPTAAEVEAARAALLAEQARREQEARDRAAAELAAERAREAQRPRAPEPAASPAPGPAPEEAPEWIIERSGRRRAPAALPSERGTNNAFIFD